MNQYWKRIGVALALFLSVSLTRAAEPFAKLKPANTTEGYLARLLINETSFPGEPKYVSEEDTKSAMLSILWVLHSRIHFIPPGYTQQQVAMVRSQNIIDIITGTGEKRICEGFYKDGKGNFVTAPRVEKRIQYLLNIANTGGKPGKFAGLLNYGQGLATAYMKEGIDAADRFAGLNRIGPVAVTGRAYSWMTDQDCYHPGGRFVSIPNNLNGSLSGNRFFSLKKEPGS
jgi:hypothetical protein